MAPQHTLADLPQLSYCFTLPPGTQLLCSASKHVPPQLFDASFLAAPWSVPTPQVPCDAKLCPYARNVTLANGTNAYVNFAPYSAFGGWIGTVNNMTSPDFQLAAYQVGMGLLYCKQCAVMALKRLYAIVHG